MSDKFLAVVKLKTGEEIIAKIEPSPELDVIALDCPAMVGHSILQESQESVLSKLNLG